MSDAAPYPSPLREPWENFEDQKRASTFGMWLFLMSEMLFFGGALIAFSYCRALDPHAFAAAARETDLRFGAGNTLVLITSSLTATLALRSAGAGWAQLASRWLAVTAGLGVLFLIVKGFEYNDDLERHLWPGADFAVPISTARAFFGFYWILTGAHAVHLAIGVGLTARLAWLLSRAGLDPRSPQIEAAILFWHLIDAFWITLFPLLYVASRA
jgi:cytochrome c oxidase subunit 3